MRYLYAITVLASQLVGSNCTRRQAKTTARAGRELTKRITAINHRAELLRTPTHAQMRNLEAKPRQSSTRNTELTPSPPTSLFPSFHCSGISHAFCRSTSDCTQRDWIARIIRTGKHSRIPSESCTLLKCIEISIDSRGRGKGAE